MMTVLLILVTLVLALAVVTMFVQMLRGELCATVWWCCGGFEAVAGLIGELIGAIAQGLSS